MKCSVNTCRNYRRSRPAGVSFHRFPADEVLQRMWKTALDREDLVINRYSMVCSDHFMQSDIIRYCNRTVLRENSVPSLHFSTERLQSSCSETEKLYCCSSNRATSHQAEAMSALPSTMVLSTLSFSEVADGAELDYVPEITTGVISESTIKGKVVCNASGMATTVPAEVMHYPSSIMMLPLDTFKVSDDTELGTNMEVVLSENTMNIANEGGRNCSMSPTIDFIHPASSISRIKPEFPGLSSQASSMIASIAGPTTVKVTLLNQTMEVLDNIEHKKANFGRQRVSKKNLVKTALDLIGKPHVESFNHMLCQGLKKSVVSIPPLEFAPPSGDKIMFKVSDVIIAKPSVPVDSLNTKCKKVYPSECRQRGETYSGICKIKLSWKNNEVDNSIDVMLGSVPVMVKSKACNLHGLSASQLVQSGEHETEWGGYFIIKGKEKIIRMLTMTRRNYPIAIKRSVWRERGNQFSDIGILIRTVRNDEVSFNNVLHYLNNGSAKFMFSQDKILSYVPVYLLLKALSSNTDEQIFSDLINGYPVNEYFLQCIQCIVREVHEQNLHTHVECKCYIGEMFRLRFPELAPWISNEEVANYIIRERILIHLNTNEDKYHMVIFMTQKLFHFSKDGSEAELIDSVMMQEVLLGGHLYQKVMTERVYVWLNQLKASVLKKCIDKTCTVNSSIIASCIRQIGNISKYMESFLATGNISSRSGLGLMQSSGLVVLAENINRMRYLSQFRAIHRGSYFTTMRTTESRQLLPDAWGFICPVHTPDGSPCGLLNHLTSECLISDNTCCEMTLQIPFFLCRLGMIPIGSRLPTDNTNFSIAVLEGKVLGHIRRVDATRIVENLRAWKLSGKLPHLTEIVFIPNENNKQYPGLYIFIGPARMMRPLYNSMYNKIEFIGTFEQAFMNITIDANEVEQTYIELSKTMFLSNLANLIPLPDCNQSPRNMYQCQMSKQTMGTPCHNFIQQSNSKLYRLQTPTKPLFRSHHHDNIKLDEFAYGTNSIVAVISYSGYDMEDAIIINKSSYERGFAYGSIYKSQFVELFGNSYFSRDPTKTELNKYMDVDGLPSPGTKLSYKCPLFCYYDTDMALYKVALNKEKEDAFIESIKYCGDFKLSSPKRICITIRISRSPSIGDKFASRAGQKGICSRKYMTEDLPFTESGLVPDIIFNPHGFPSRMTIAMMIEAMAGKNASIHGIFYDATPFAFTEKISAVNYFGKLLEASGYDYYGTECMYSGEEGRAINVNIFFGIVYYQRLRHMVFDKWQVRSTGPVDAMFQQPIKGRKRGGGVRFGEMERDALISHGSSFLLQDRLLSNSDKVSILVCNKCGTIIGPMRSILKRFAAALKTMHPSCRICQTSSTIDFLEIPYALKFLFMELASININACFKISLM